MCVYVCGGKREREWQRIIRMQWNSLLRQSSRLLFDLSRGHGSRGLGLGLVQICEIMKRDTRLGGYVWFRGGLVFEAHRLVYHSI